MAQVTASKEKGIDPQALVHDLLQAIAERGSTQADRDPRALSTEALIAHVVSTHHEYLRKALPFVRTLAVKVSRVHGDHNPRLRELEVVVLELNALLLLAVGKLLERMRTATEDFGLPTWACNSYRTLVSELEQLEGDTLRHVHLENYVLAPRFRAG